MKLSEKLRRLSVDAAHLEEKNAGLRTQLAWTPVSNGLPTEPGVYEFAAMHDGEVREFVLLERRDGNSYAEWGDMLTAEDIHEDELECQGLTRYRLTHYRRIELPNGD